MIGTQLAHFNITGKLGEGGMGEVYRAEDTKLGREVAIKVLPEMVAADAERLARFEREAKLLASLNHPNIGAIYAIESADVTEAGDNAAQEAGPVKFLVLELIEGETLAESIADGPLPIEKALQIGQQIALALEAAHAKGVIHRDLKPANVKLTPDGKAKVLDFGLAKAWDVEESSGSSPLISRSPTLTQGMTEVGVLLGTAAYMSPEQARGKPVDKRADIWAFGCIMLEMLSGRKVFGGDTVTDMIAAVVATEPEWDKLPSDTPRALERLLRRCLEKDQDQRLRDVGDARLEIEELMSRPADELREPEVAVGPAKSGRLWQMLTVALAVVAAGLGIALWLSTREAPQPVTRAFIPAPPEGDFDLVTDFPAPLALSPNGRMLVYGVQEEGTTKRLWVRGLDDLEARPLNGTEGALYPFWSSDSRFVAFFSQGKLKKIEVAGGPAMTLCDAANGKGGSWNRDGVIIFAPSHTTMIHRVAAAGGDSVAITQLDPEMGEDSHRHPRFLPDGEHFLFAARSGFGGQSSNSRIMVGSLSGDKAKEIMPTSSNAEYAAGHLLYVYESTLMARPFDAERRELVGDAFPLAEDVYSDVGALLGAFSTTEAGVLAYQTGTMREAVLASLEWRDREGNVLSTVGDPGPFSEVNLSLDNGSALVSLADTTSANRDIWLVDIERGLRTRFTFDAAQDWIGVWSPDGNQIVFTSEREGSSDLFIKQVTGGGEAEMLFDDGKLKYPLSWSRDGRYVSFESWGSDGAAQIYLLELENPSEPRHVQPSEATVRWPVISPDGQWLAYISNESGPDQVFVTAMPDGGRKWQVSDRTIGEVRWNGDQELLMLSQDGTLMSAEVDGSGGTFRVGRVEKLFEADVPTAGFGFDVSSDGQRILIASTSADPGAAARMDPLTLVLNWTEDLNRR